MLREQNERNRMILETANDAFIGMDPDGTITAWNPQAELTFGWAAAEAIGRTLVRYRGGSGVPRGPCAWRGTVPDDGGRDRS